MSKKSSLAKNTAILAFGKFSTQLITFLMLPLYTSYISPSEYGVVDLVVTYIALLAPSVTLQIEMAVFRFLIDARGDNKKKSEIITNVFEVALTMTLLLVILAITLSQLVSIPNIWLISAILASSVFSGLVMQISRGLGDNTKFALASIVTGVVTVVSNIYLIVFHNMGALGLLISMLAAQVAAIAYISITLKIPKYINLDYRDKKLKKELLKYSIPLVPNGVSWWVINAADRTIISIFLGASSNGVYAIASKFPLIFSSIFSVFGMSWTEAASVNINDKDRDIFFSDTFNSAIRFFGTLGLCIISAIPFVFPFLVNSSYVEAYLYIPVMILGALFNSVVGLYSAIYVAKKLTKQVASTSIVAAVISIVINLSLINIIGIFAAALANAVAFLSMAIYRHYDSKKFVTIKYNYSAIGILILAYIVVFASYYLNLLILNIATLLLVILFGILLNRNIILNTLNSLGRYKKL